MGGGWQMANYKIKTQSTALNHPKLTGPIPSLARALPLDLALDLDRAQCDGKRKSRSRSRSKSKNGGMGA